MPPKREIDSSDESAAATPTKKQRSPDKVKTKWSEAEETKFRAGIDRVVKAALWAELKNDPDLAKRGANGVREHWKALYKKL